MVRMVAFGKFDKLAKFDVFDIWNTRTWTIWQVLLFDKLVLKNLKKFVNSKNSNSIKLTNSQMLSHCTQVWLWTIVLYFYYNVVLDALVELVYFGEHQISKCKVGQTFILVWWLSFWNLRSWSLMLLLFSISADWIFAGKLRQECINGDPSVF